MSRRSAFVNLQMVLAGERVEDALGACSDNIASVVAFACSTPEEADALLDGLVIDIKAAMRTNWTYIRSVRAAAPRSGRA